MLRDQSDKPPLIGAIEEMKELVAENSAYRKQLEAENASLRNALHWIAGYGENEGDFLDPDGWAEGMRNIAINALAVGQ